MIKLKTAQLHRICDGLNIEGGNLYKKIKEDHNNKNDFLWANLNIILDQLSENISIELNEHKILSILLLLIQYYIYNGHLLLKKKNTSYLKISVHISKILVKMDLYKQINKHLCMLMEIPDNVEIEYMDNQINNYSDTNILISLNHCITLSSNYKIGTIFICDTYIPFNTNIIIPTLNVNKQYKVKNDIIKRLNSILRSDFHTKTINYVNMYYKSKNINDKANLLAKDDFIRTLIIQIDNASNLTIGNKIINVE